MVGRRNLSALPNTTHRLFGGPFPPARCAGCAHTWGTFKDSITKIVDIPREKVRLSLSPQGVKTCSYLQDDVVIEDSYRWGSTIYLDWTLMIVFIKVEKTQCKKRNVTPCAPHSFYVCSFACCARLRTTTPPTTVTATKTKAHLDSQTL